MFHIPKETYGTRERDLCRIQKETYYLKEPTHRSRPIIIRVTLSGIARTHGVATLAGSLKLHVSFAEEPYKRETTEIKHDVDNRNQTRC